jgi:hypothetical protein
MTKPTRGNVRSGQVEGTETAEVMRLKEEYDEERRRGGGRNQLRTTSM